MFPHGNNRPNNKSKTSASCNKEKQLKLSGSQMNLAPRDESPRRSTWVAKSRPSSACHRPRPRSSVSCRRPSSVNDDFRLPMPSSHEGSTFSLCENLAVHKQSYSESNLIPLRTKSDFLQVSCKERRLSCKDSMGTTSRDVIKDCSLRCKRPMHIETNDLNETGRDHSFHHAYTAASSQLLQSLLREPWRSDFSEDSSTPRSDKSLGDRIKEIAEGSRTNVTEKSDSDPQRDTDRTESTLCLRDSEVRTAVANPDLETRSNRDVEVDMKFVRWFPNHETVEREKEVGSIENKTSARSVDVAVSKNEESQRWFPNFDKTDHEKMVGFIVNKAPIADATVDKDESAVLIDLTDEVIFPKSQPGTVEHSSIEKDIKQSDMKAVTPRDSTYEDLVSILNVLETEQSESSLRAFTPRESPHSSRLASKSTAADKPSHSTTQASEIFSYLDQVERSTEPVKLTAPLHINESKPNCVINASNVPRLEELLCKNTVDLAQEVLSLRLQSEEQAGGIRLLQQTVSELKMTIKENKVAHQAQLDKAANEAEEALTRHQKMVKQLLAEKKALNEKVATLLAETKATEERHQRNLKAMEERHLIEIQRVKETQSAAEKLKREKWIDVKTQKIKEMTVKGLEPELSRMAARQQQELTELRNLHRAEIEAIELRAARRSSELLDQLRAELARDKEEALQREAAAQRARFEKALEEEQRRSEEECRRLKDDLRREKDRMTALEAHVQESLAEARRNAERERERDRASIIRDHEERTEEIHRLHQNEIRSLKDALEIEKEVWMNNYKKLQNNKMLEREAELHHQYKKDRDRDIEIAIDRLETEATKTRLELTESYENRLTRLREKQDAELRDVEMELNSTKNKLSDTRLVLARKEDEITELSTRLRHQQSELIQMKKLCEEMSHERMDLRKILRTEFEDQLADAAAVAETLRAEIAELRAAHLQELNRRDQLAEIAKADAERELQHVYNRVRVTISKKDEALETLREQYKVALERCSHLEVMLDNQRRNLLLK